VKGRSIAGLIVTMVVASALAQDSDEDPDEIADFEAVQAAHEDANSKISDEDFAAAIAEAQEGLERNPVCPAGMDRDLV
jgi:hypothetical protein